MKIEQHHCTLIVHTKRCRKNVHFSRRGTRECYTWPAGKMWRISGKQWLKFDSYPGNHEHY